MELLRLDKWHVDWDFTIYLWISKQCLTWPYGNIHFKFHFVCDNRTLFFLSLSCRRIKQLNYAFSIAPRTSVFIWHRIAYHVLMVPIRIYSFTLGFYAFTIRPCRPRHYVFRLSHWNGFSFVRSFVRPSVRSSGQINYNATFHELLEQSRWNLRGMTISPTDDLVRFWRSKVKVTAGLRVWWRSRRCVEARLLISANGKSGGRFYA